MFKKIFKITIIILLVLVILAFGGITYFTNNIISDMADMRVEPNSDQLAEYENQINNIEVTTSDDIKINAWHFKQPDPKAIAVIIHGMHGQAGASLLNFGKFFHENNFAAFCIDLRAHGLSGGKQIGFGYTETRDVKALLDWINNQPEYEDKEIVLYGISMGGATAINTAAKYNGIDQIISVSSFASYENTFLDYMRSDGAPELMVQAFKPSIRLILALRYDINPQKEAPVSNIKDIDIPIYIVHGDQDQQILVQQAKALKKAAGSNAELWIVKDQKHMVVTDILKEENQWYRDKILEFINKNM